MESSAFHTRSSGKIRRGARCRSPCNGSRSPRNEVEIGTGHPVIATSWNYLMRECTSWHRGRTAREPIFVDALDEVTLNEQSSYVSAPLAESTRS
jgi:hypothetical protein